MVVDLQANNISERAMAAPAQCSQTEIHRDLMIRCLVTHLSIHNKAHECADNVNQLEKLTHFSVTNTQPRSLS